MSVSDVQHIGRGDAENTKEEEVEVVVDAAYSQEGCTPGTNPDQGSIPTGSTDDSPRNNDIGDVSIADLDLGFNDAEPAASNEHSSSARLPSSSQTTGDDVASSTDRPEPILETEQERENGSTPGPREDDAVDPADEPAINLDGLGNPNSGENPTGDHAGTPAAVVEVNAEKDLLLYNPTNASIAAPQITIQDVFRLRKIGGGIGDGLDIAGELPLVSIDDDSKDDLPDLSPAEFCQEYRLCTDIRDLLIKYGYDSIGSLLDVKESELKSLGFKIGHNAELRWALKKMMLAKFGTVPIRNEEGKYKPILSGGTGGAGGAGGRQGGEGGAGRSSQIDGKDLCRFSQIRGGTSGAGGSAGKAAVENYGGIGTNGIPGSHGKAVRMFGWQVSFFEEITGGIGGAGGPGLLQGGHGGDGEGVKFPTPLLSIDNETRSWLLPTKLQDFTEIGPELRQLLEEQGFHSVEGLCEAYDTDLLEVQDGRNQQSPFKEGDIPVLKRALTEFVKEQKKQYENRHSSL
ncbi:hypothetical protein DFH09DRAFT_1121915 [Mycena vulgaris]|nr:hypothetical protein DFH09DRAFT_1121915 [Mycena vulgaris]